MTMLRRKGQSTAEYAIMISVVVAAVVGMQLYLKRGLQGKEKDVTDHIGTKLAEKVPGLTATAQYEPYYAQSDYTVTQNAASTQAYKAGGTVNRTVTNDDTTRTGSSTQGVDLSQDDAWTPAATP